MPRCDAEQWVKQVFSLCWIQYGGSGLNITWSEALDLEVRDRDSLLQLITDTRESEAKAIRDAQSQSKGRR